MKIKCIYNYGWGGSLTIGKIYDAIKIYDAGYVIIDDNGYKFLYSKECFKLLSEMRNEKIDKLLAE
jgi:hypothetical protein